MKLIIKETLLLLVVVLIANIALLELADIDTALLHDITKTLLISLCIQPWVIYQFNH